MDKPQQERNALVRESDELVQMHPKTHQEEHERQIRVKSGAQRLDRRSAQGVRGGPKKSGQGGKFTWGGPLNEADDFGLTDGAPSDLDEKDPNYVDKEEEVNTRGPPGPSGASTVTSGSPRQKKAQTQGGRIPQ